MKERSPHEALLALFRETEAKEREINAEVVQLVSRWLSEQPEIAQHIEGKELIAAQGPGSGYSVYVPGKPFLLLVDLKSKTVRQLTKPTHSVHI